jgi:hypothetical protein
LFGLSGAFAFSVCSAVKFKDLAISLENSAVPTCAKKETLFPSEKVFTEKCYRCSFGKAFL